VLAAFEYFVIGQAVRDFEEYCPHGPFSPRVLTHRRAYTPPPPILSASALGKAVCRLRGGLPRELTERRLYESPGAAAG
jgi:hypothetical protein